MLAFTSTPSASVCPAALTADTTPSQFAVKFKLYSLTPVDVGDCTVVFTEIYSTGRPSASASSEAKIVLNSISENVAVAFLDA